MKPIVILVIAVLAVGVIVWLCSGSGAPPAKPSPSTSGPSVGIVDGIQVQLDAKSKATLAVKLDAQRNELKQLLAVEQLDADVARTQLKSYDELTADVAATRQELATRGTSAAEIDAWLVKHQWAETQALAQSLRDKLAAAPAQ